MKWQSVIIVSLIAFLLGLSLRNCKKLTNNGDKITIDTVYTDTIWQDTGSFHVKIIPKPYKVDSFIYIHDSIPYKIDTPKVVYDYYLSRKYKLDTTANDVEVTLNQTIFKNRITKFNLGIKNNRSTTINTITKKTIITSPPILYIGGGMSTNGSVSDINGMVGYNRGKTLYIASYGFYTKTVNLGVMIKIK